MEELLLDPRYRPVLSIIKALRNGLMYGIKIRLPHSLIMTFLFHDGSIKTKLEYIMRATIQHGKNLAIFGVIYKSIRLLLQRIWGSNHPIHTYIAAVTGGYFAFGTNNPINMQVNMYLLSRITVGLSRLAVKKQIIPQPKFNVFPLFAITVWGVALLLFENHPDTLQPSLQNSMSYLFHQSTVWHGIADFILYNSDSLW